MPLLLETIATRLTTLKVEYLDSDSLLPLFDLIYWCDDLPPFDYAGLFPDPDYNEDTSTPPSPPEPTNFTIRIIRKCLDEDDDDSIPIMTTDSPKKATSLIQQFYNGLPQKTQDHLELDGDTVHIVKKTLSIRHMLRLRKCDWGETLTKMLFTTIYVLPDVTQETCHLRIIPTWCTRGQCYCVSATITHEEAERKLKEFYDSLSSAQQQSVHFTNGSWLEANV